MNNVTADGASENRSCNKALATHSLLEVFGFFLTDEQKKVLPVEMKVAFRHPILDDVWIFVGGVMPHLIKKIINAFDRSGKKKSTDLKFRWHKMSLENVYEIWECDGGRMGDIRTHILTKDHFEKNLIGACVFFWRYKECLRVCYV